MPRPTLYWIITDTHWFHDKCVEHCGRPANYMQLTLSNLRKYVAKQDVLIHLGDVILYRYPCLKSMLDSIPGTKFLTMGNHDRKKKGWYTRNGFSGVFKCLQIDDILFSHKPQHNFPDGVRLNVHGHWHRDDNSNEERYRDWYNTDQYRKLSLEEQKYKPVEMKRFTVCQ